MSPSRIPPAPPSPAATPPAVPRTGAEKYPLAADVPIRAAADLPSASDVSTMGEVRMCIDSLDREIVALLGRRMRYIEAAARIKPAREEVRDDSRVKDVIEKVKATAKRPEVDFPEEVVERVYATLVEGSILHEFTKWDVRREDVEGEEQ